MNNKLAKLAAKEEKILAKIAAIEGDIEQRIKAIRDQKIFEKYQKVHKKYLKLAQQTDDAAVAEEALRRGIFINWFAFVEPDFVSGIGEIAEEVTIEFYSIVEDQISEQTITDDLVWMLYYYAATSDWAILYYAERRFPNLTRFVRRSDRMLLPVLVEKLDDTNFEDRGQMGDYWQAVIEQQVS